MITEIAPAPERAVSGPARPRGTRRAWDEVPRWHIYLPLSVYLLFTLIPFYWILLFALRPAGSTSLVPWPMTFDHFEKVWTERSFGLYFQNSVLVGVATLVLTTVVALAGGYALARFDFRLKRGFMLALLCSQFVPGALLLVPLFQIFAKLSMINSLGSVIIAETVFQLPLSMILISGFIKNVPPPWRRPPGWTAATASPPSGSSSCRCCGPG